MSDEHDHDTAVAAKVAVEALWGGVRIVVIDTETTQTPGGGPLRAVSMAAVTCTRGSVRGKWERFINPGVPVDRESRRIHGITDDHLAGEPMFADLAASLINQLTPGDGERLVVAAHYAAFDIAVLRHELQLVGLDLPDLPVIDTMGKLASLVGVTPAGRSLPDLLDALGITNAKAHSALGDATACAEALVELLERAAIAGRTDLDELLAELGSETTLATRPSRKSRADSSPQSPTLPASHVEGHATTVSKRAGTKMLTTWRTQVAECAQLRCRHLDARVLEAQASPVALLAELEAVLDDCCTANDAAGAATVLHALLPLVQHLPPKNGRLGLRNAALAWSKHWAAKLNPLGRCEGKDLCPACRRREPCALDTWPDTVAPIALGDPARYAKGFFEMTGAEAGTGAYTNWIATGVDPRIADAAVWLCVEHWHQVGQDTRAGQVVQQAFDAGCRHPDVADAYAGQLGAAGRLTNLNAGVAVCEQAAMSRQGSTHEGWTRLASRHSQLAGRAQRLTARPSGQFDEDGNPIPMRRHHPDTPRRSRPGRFLPA